MGATVPYYEVYVCVLWVGLQRVWHFMNMGSELGWLNKHFLKNESGK